MLKRKGLIKFSGKDVTIVGEDIRVGQLAPDFKVHTADWTLVSALKTTKGKVRIITAVLSLETSVCDRETHRFNQEAASLSKDIAILVISTDLPYTQKRWCGAAGIDQVLVVSDHLKTEFGKKYGCLIEEIGILRRAVFVVNRKGIVTYAVYMTALGNEPDYEAVLKAAQEALTE